MKTYLVFSRAEVLNEDIDHTGHRVKADTIREASSKAKKWIRFEKIKEFFIVCYEDWDRDPDFGKLRLNPKTGNSRKMSIVMKMKGYHYLSPHTW